MLDDIFETKVKGSRTMFLNVPSKEYFSSYDTLDKSTAQEMVNTYFQIKEKDGVPYVDAAEEDSIFNTVKIKINVEHGSQNNLEPYKMEDFLSMSNSR